MKLKNDNLYNKILHRELDKEECNYEEVYEFLTLLTRFKN